MCTHFQYILAQSTVYTHTHTHLTEIVRRLRTLTVYIHIKVTMVLRRRKYIGTGKPTLYIDVQNLDILLDVAYHFDMNECSNQLLTQTYVIN